MVPSIHKPIPLNLLLMRVLTARIIEEELLADILSNAELSSWFNRVTIHP